MKRLFTVLTSAALAIAGAQAGTFTNFTSSGNYTDVAFDGNIMWAATQGGLVKHDLDADTFRVYTTQDGLPDNSIIGVAVADNGDIWLSLLDPGIYHFDGTSFEQHEFSNPYYRITYMQAVAADGHVWALAFGTPLRALEYDGAVWTSYDSLGGLADYYGSLNLIAPIGCPVTALHFMASSTLSDRHAIRFGLTTKDGDTFRSVTTSRYAITGDQGISALTFIPGSGLHIGSQGALTRLNGSGWTTYSVTDDYEKITHLARGAGSRLWGTKDSGLYEMSDGVWTHHDLGDTANNGITALYADGRGNVWTAYSHRSSRGVYTYDGSVWTRITALADMRIYDITQDRSGDVWMATYDGAARLHDTTVTVYGTEMGLPTTRSAAIAADSSGGIWCGTSEGAARFDGSTWTAYTTTDGLAADRIYDIMTARDGSVWFATSSGISVYDGSDITTVLSGTVMDTLENVYSLCQSQGDTIYAGTQEGLTRFDGTSWKTLAGKYDNELVNPCISDLAWSTDGTYWIATGFGLVSFDGTEWTWRTAGDTSLPGLGLLDVIVASDGTIWCAADSGVYHGDGTDWTIYREADGLGTNYSRWISEAPDGRIIAGHANGYSVFSGTSWKYYITRPDDEMTSSYLNCITIDGDNTVWIGSNIGVEAYDGTWRDFAPQPPPYWHVDDILADRNGDIWATTLTGLKRRHDGIWSDADPDSLSIPYSSTRELSVDSAGNVWYLNQGSEPTKGPRMYDGSTWSVHDTIGEFTVECSYSITVGTNGVCYFNLNIEHPDLTYPASAIFSYDGSTWTMIDSSINRDFQGAKLSTGNHNAIWLGGQGYYLNDIWYDAAPTGPGLNGKGILDHGGILWFTTYDGIWGYDGTQWANYTAEHGLVDNTVNDIAVDASNRKWIATANGLSILEENELGIHELLSPEATADLIRMHVGPNPFTGSVRITLERQGASAPEAVRIIDRSGTAVATFTVTGNAGTWNGRNAAGEEMPAGVYFAQPMQGDGTATVRIIKTK